MNDELWHMDDTWYLNAIMENVADSIYIKDRQCRIVRASKKMAQSCGFSDPSKLIGQTDRTLFGQELGEKTAIDDLHVMDTGQPLIGLVENHVLKNGEINWTSTTKLPLRNDQGEIIGMLGITREINELKRTELDLQHIATHDILTSLPNRYLFFNRLEHAICRAKRQDCVFAILFIDLDHFKMINDQLGHDSGDQILKVIALSLKNLLRESDTVARIGGDEFVLLLENIQNHEEPAVVAMRILTELIIIMNSHSLDAKLGASIGISLYPQDSKDASGLIKAADHAMYQAKTEGNTFRFYAYPQIPE
jgi:diguanylate cyclase (GGDEF)-like protein/PAS domain S-box-containing protein